MAAKRLASRVVLSCTELVTYRIAIIHVRFEVFIQEPHGLTFQKTPF
jgi:hypothetical protein